MNIKNNSHRRSALIWIGVMIIGIIIIFIPRIIGLAGFDGGFALSFLGGFVAIVGLIATIIYARLAVLMDRITKGENILAHWTYTPEQWKEYTEKEHTEDKTGRKSIFIMVGAIAIIVGIASYVVVRDRPLLITGIVLGIIVIGGLSAYFSGLVNRRRSKKCLGEAFVALDGVYLNRQLHIWKGIGNRLENITYDDQPESQPYIRFDYSSPSRDERYYYTSRVPVPPGQENVAHKIVADISAAHLSK